MRKPGRPRKTSADLRALPFTVRLTPGEAVQLDVFAKEAGLSASEFVRAQALSKRARPAMAADLQHDVYRLLLSLQHGLRDGMPLPSLAERMNAVLARLQA